MLLTQNLSTMKKLLLTLIVSFALCGSMFAQYHLDSHWPDFYYPHYEDQVGLVASIMIDGEIITTDYDGWDNLEIAAFTVVGDTCRSNWNFMTDEYVLEYGDPFPILDGVAIFYTPGQPAYELYFMMYDHQRNIEYGPCEVLYLGEPLTILTGVQHDEGWDDPENPIFLSFTTPALQTFTKEINGYVDPEGNDNYYLIASPVGNISAGAVGSLVSNNFDFYSFNQSAASEEWVNLVEAAEEEYEMQIGVGYLYANSDTVTLVFTGTPIDPEEEAEYPIALDYDINCTTEWQGYNLIGNPYAEPAFLDREYLRLVDGEYDLVENYSEEAVDMIEGVFVQAESENDTVTFNIGAGTEPLVPDEKVVLKVAQGRGIVDRAVIRFGEGHQMTKVQFNSSHSKLYIPQDGKDYAVVRSAEMGEMPVNFKAGESGSYMLSVDPKNVEFNYLHLIDNMTGADVDLLATPSYSFEANTSDYASRFKLVYATGSNSDDSFAFFSNGSFVISNEGEATLQVVDVMGRILKSETISGSANVNVNAAPGVYMLRLINGNDVKVQKVIVK